MTRQSVRAVCRILNNSSCGSGSICGIRDGKALILTNAHVAGTNIGRIVNVYVESTGDTIKARVIMAAYSSRTSTDWAILETVETYTKIKPVKLSKKRPRGSHYTKGFPRCQPHNGTDIRTVRLTISVWYWQPTAISGQSGSGVWSDDDHLCYGIVTWRIGNDGAGQPTAQIYDQSRRKTTAAEPRVDGQIELDGDDYDFAGIEKPDDCDDPEVSDGFSEQVSVSELPIWAEDDPPTPPDDPGEKRFTRDDFIEFCRDAEEFFEGQRLKFESLSDKHNTDNDMFT